MSIRFGSGLKAIAALGVLALSGQAYAATAHVTSPVTRILLHDSSFGGCMAGLNNIRLTGCTTGFATFDCKGSLTGTDTVMAYRMLDQAQLALATNKSVFVTIDSSLVINGYCKVTRIDILK
ncbi:hypothetical protein TI04_03685 [Achromatium sp. WMS2]|nr:hypothetical protein TI04_03685 [Achromatium sp. WMS2]